MKTFPIYFVIAISAFTFTSHLHSQAPAAPKTPLQQVQALKAQNQQVLEKQAATLVKLDALQKEAAQIKFLAARS
jgi:hypothetical protein